MARKQTYQQRYDSVNAAIPKRSDAYADNVDIFDRAEKLSENPQYLLRWFGTTNADKVRDLIAHGWKEGVDRMLDAFGKISGDFQATNIKRQIVRGDHGDDLDIHRVLSGSLGDAWTRRKRQRKSTPSVVTIGCDLTMSYDQHADELFWRGAAVLRLADILTDAGYAVEIKACMFTVNCTENGDSAEQVVTVKESGDPLDLNNLATTLCLSGFFRLVCLQNMTRIKSTLRGSLGRVEPEHRPDELKDAIFADGHIRDVGRAKAWLEMAVAKFSDDYKEAA